MQRNFLRGLLDLPDPVPRWPRVVRGRGPEKYRLGHRPRRRDHPRLRDQPRAHQAAHGGRARPRTRPADQPPRREDGLDQRRDAPARRTRSSGGSTRPTSRTSPSARSATRRVEIILPHRRRDRRRPREPLDRGDRGGQAAHLPDGRAGVPHPRQRHRRRRRASRAAERRRSTDDSRADARTRLDERPSRAAAAGPEPASSTSTIGDTEARGPLRVGRTRARKNARSSGLSNASRGHGGSCGPSWPRARDRARRSCSTTGSRSARHAATARGALQPQRARSVEQLQRADRTRQAPAREPEMADDEVERRSNQKKFEYFVLTRVSPEDSLQGRRRHHPDAPARTPTRRRSTRASTSRSTRPGPGSSARSPSGTSRPASTHPRQLAIILDEQDRLRPDLKREITTQRPDHRASSTSKSVDRLVQILRSGALHGRAAAEAGEREHHRPDARQRHDPQGDDGRRHGVRRGAGVHGRLLPLRRAGRVHRPVRQPAPDGRRSWSR